MRLSAFNSYTHTTSQRNYTISSSLFNWIYFSQDTIVISLHSVFHNDIPFIWYAFFLTLSTALISTSCTGKWKKKCMMAHRHVCTYLWNPHSAHHLIHLVFSLFLLHCCTLLTHSHKGERTRHTTEIREHRHRRETDIRWTEQFEGRYTK